MVDRRIMVLLLTQEENLTSTSSHSDCLLDNRDRGNTLVRVHSGTMAEEVLLEHVNL